MSTNAKSTESLKSSSFHLPKSGPAQNATARLHTFLRSPRCKQILALEVEGSILPSELRIAGQTSKTNSTLEGFTTWMTSDQRRLFRDIARIVSEIGSKSLR